MNFVWFGAGLVLLQGFFSGAEAALLGADSEALAARAAAGSPGAKSAQWFLARPQDRLLPTTLIGGQLCILINGLLVSLTAKGTAASWAAMALLAAGVLMVICGRLVPRSLGEEHADALAPLVARPLRLAHLVFRPLSFGLASVVGSVSRALGLEHARLVVTREEIESALAAPRTLAPAGTEGELTEPERSMIAAIFDFGDRTVYDVMVPLSEVAAIPEDSTMDDAVVEIQDKRHTRMPVYRERVDQVVGVLHAFDVLKAPRGATIADVARAPLFVPESQPIIDLLVTLQQKREGLAVVVDEYGGATGIVTVEDILEEIVGPIEDEFDAAEPSSIRQESAGVWRVAGRTPISEVNRVLKVQLPEGEDYESVAGLLLDRFRRIPRENESLKVSGVVITVMGASERAVEDVRIRK